MSRPVRRAVGGLAVLSLASAALLTSVVTDAGQAQASTWAPTLTQAIHLTGTSLGATPASQGLHLTIALTPRNAEAMAAAIKPMYTPGSATYQHYLSAAQWRARYAPTKASVAQVTSYLEKAGLTGVEVASNRLEITAEATAGTAERAFHTSLTSYLVGGRHLYANDSAAQVPSSLHTIVSSVIGLNDVPLDAVQAKTVAAPTREHRAARATTSKAGAPSTAGLFPSQFRTTYAANGTPSGKNTPIAVLSEGLTAPVISSLRIAEKAEKAPKVPVTVVKAGVQSQDAAGLDEFDMDTQASSIMASNVNHLYMYNIGSLSDAQVTFGINSFVADDKALAMSASIGGCEYAAYIDGSELSLDQTMQEAAIQGQSLFASSGDEGDACAMVANTGTPAGVPQDEWPAVGAFTTAVGGTSLVSDANGNRIQELAWLGGGGGDSDFENPGYWTEDTDPGFDTEFASGGRAVPDVALDADPNVSTPVKVYVGKTISYVGGTSLSSPLMLGIWARLETAHQNRLGLASIPLYTVYDKVNPGTTVNNPAGVPVVVPAANPAPVKGFTDIIAGANGAYSATPGWDYATGLGAPNVKELVKSIQPTITAAATKVKKPGFKVSGRIASSHGTRHLLAVTVRITNTTKNVPATGKLVVQVVNGRSCTATVKKSVGRCKVLTTKAKKHALRISYSGDKHYRAETRRKTIETK